MPRAVGICASEGWGGTGSARTVSARPCSLFPVLRVMAWGWVQPGAAGGRPQPPLTELTGSSPGGVGPAGMVSWPQHHLSKTPEPVRPTLGLSKEVSKAAGHWMSAVSQGDGQGGPGLGYPWGTVDSVCSHVLQCRLPLQLPKA